VWGKGADFYVANKTASSPFDSVRNTHLSLESRQSYLDIETFVIQDVAIS
jgi:hypothetical protein